VGHVACMAVLRNKFKILVGNLNEETIWKSWEKMGSKY
jgi:hypothetical protein